MFNGAEFVPDRIVEVVGGMSDFVLRYALALAATSALAMALIEAWKSIQNSRPRFHMRHIYKWISEAPLPEIAPNQETPFRLAGFKDQVYRTIILLTTGVNLDERYALHRIAHMSFDNSSSNALFALELDRMMGQLQEAADIVLTNPGIYPELYRFLTTGAALSDIQNWEKDSATVPDEDVMNRMQMKSRVDAFSRLNKFVKRRLDSLQITMSYEWSRWNQWSSICLGAGLLFLSLSYIEISTSAWAVINPLTWARIIVASLIGGIVAPVAKDLVVALKKVRSDG